MKILICGVNGQLGRELFIALKEGKTALAPISPIYQTAIVSGVDIDTADLSSLNVVRELFLKEQPDLVFNCAAYTNVDQCEEDEALCFQANAIIPKNLAQMCALFGAKLLHISTDYVFSGENAVPYSERDIPNPKTAYGKSKLLGETHIKDFSNQYFIMRTAWLYGYYGKNFVKTILNAAKEKGALRVVADQIGNPTNCQDLIHHMLKIALTEDYGIYHCTGKGECSWYDFAYEILRYTKSDASISPCTTDEYPHKANRPHFSSLDHNMLRLTIGDDMRSWQDALHYFLDHFAEKAEGI